MFGNNHKKNGKLDKELKDTSSNINIIGKGTEIKGEVKTEGDIRIDGHLEGNIYSDSKVVIGKSGKVEGDITCQHADILGKVEGGTIEISQLLSLKSSAEINAKITTNKLVVEPGASFNGNCRMSGDRKKKGGKNAQKSKTKQKQTAEK